MFWIIVPGMAAAADSKLENSFVVVEPLMIEASDTPHWQYDLVLDHEFSALKPRWQVIQGPEVSLVIHPDDSGDLSFPFGYAGPAMQGTRMLDPEFSILVPYPNGPDFEPGMPFETWQGEGTIEAIHIQLDPAEGRGEAFGYETKQYTIEIEVSTIMNVDDRPQALTNLLVGDLWVAPKLPFSDAVFLPYFHPFQIEPFETIKHVQDELLSVLSGLGMLVAVDVTFFHGLDAEDLERVRQKEQPRQVWPQRIVYTLEDLQEVGAPPYEQMLAGLSLIDWAGYERLVTGLTLFDIWKPCFPLPVPWDEIDLFPELGTVAGLSDGVQAVNGMVMHGGSDEEGDLSFGVHVTAALGDGVTLCLALLRVDAGIPEPGVYQVLPASEQASLEQSGDFVGYVVGVIGDDPLDEWGHTTFITLESVGGELVIDEIGIAHEQYEGEWMTGSLKLQAIGVLLDDLSETLHLDLDIDIESIEAFYAAPQAL